MIEFAILAACGVALLSLIGVLVFGEHPHTERLHRVVLPFAVGIFLGVVFFELIPETLEGSASWGSDHHTHWVSWLLSSLALPRYVPPPSQ